MEHPFALLVLRILVTFVLMVGINGQSCPEKCTCSKTTIRCVGVDKVPEGIGQDIMKIHLSYCNFSNINESSFVRFKILYSLSLVDCGLSKRFLIPETLNSLDLTQNPLLKDVVKEILTSTKTSLERITLVNNGIKFLPGNFSIFPPSVTHLELDGNDVSAIHREELKGLPNLQTLSLAGTNLSYISKGAFDSLKSLREVYLQRNRLTELPTRLFKNTQIKEIGLEGNKLTTVPDLSGTSYVAILDLRGNQITHVNATMFVGSKFRLPIFNSLILGSNKIETVDFRVPVINHLDLSHNQIHSLGEGVFQIKSTTGILLQSNQISSVHPRAFKGMPNLGYLHLQRNKLSYLPKGVFSNMKIHSLFLFDNNLKGMNGVLDGMKSQPVVLVMFGNKHLQFIQSEDYRGMSDKAKIYIDCKNLKEISSPHLMQAKIVCSPSEINVGYDGLKEKGFQCQNDPDNEEEKKCKPCQPGYEGVYDKDTLGCNPCPPGSFYQDEMAATSCKNCPLGQYVPIENAPGKNPLDCLTCPKGTNTNKSAGYRACPCLRGYARKHRFGECSKCIENGYTCERDYRQLKRGFWSTWDGMNVSKYQTCKEMYKLFTTNLQIEDNTYDRNTINFSCNMPIAVKCPMPEACLGGVEAKCNENYTGVLCASCNLARGYMKSFKTCTKCLSRATSVLLWVVYFLIFVGICWLMSALDKIPLAKRGTTDEKNEKTFVDLIQSSLKILMGFYQVLVGIMHAYSGSHWPDVLRKAVSFFEYVQLSFLRIPSLHCINPEWHTNAVTEFWFSISATFCVPLFIILYYCFRALLARYHPSKADFKERCREYCKNCLQVIVFFLFATYPLISAKILQLLPPSCHTFYTSKQNGNYSHSLSYLRSDYSVKCPSASNTADIDIRYVYVSLLLPLGLPCLLLFLLWKFSPNESQDVNKSSEDIAYRRGSFNYYLLSENQPSIATQALKITYGNYKTNCWYWEFIEMIRKLLTVVVSSFLLQNIKTGLFGNVLISIIFVVLHARNWPMKDKLDNYMQQLALVSVSINLFYIAINTSSVGDADIIEPNKDAFCLGFMLTILNSLLLLFVVGRFIWEIVMKCMEKMNGSIYFPIEPGDNGGGEPFYDQLSL